LLSLPKLAALFPILLLLLSWPIDCFVNKKYHFCSVVSACCHLRHHQQLFSASFLTEELCSLLAALLLMRLPLLLPPIYCWVYLVVSTCCCSHHWMIVFLFTSCCRHLLRFYQCAAATVADATNSLHLRKINFSVVLFLLLFLVAVTARYTFEDPATNLVCHHHHFYSGCYHCWQSGNSIWQLLAIHHHTAACSCFHCAQCDAVAITQPFYLHCTVFVITQPCAYTVRICTHWLLLLLLLIVTWYQPLSISPSRGAGRNKMLKTMTINWLYRYCFSPVAVSSSCSCCCLLHGNSC